MEEVRDTELSRDDSLVAGLFRTHSRRMRNLMGFRLRSPEDGEEAAQEVFLKFWRMELKGSLQEEARSYLFSAAYTAIIDTERSRASRGHDLRVPAEDLDVLPAAEPDPEEALHWRRAVHHLVAVLDDLPELSRRVFALYYFADMNCNQVAAELGVTRRTVERHLSRSLHHCRASMSNYL